MLPLETLKFHFINVCGGEILSWTCPHTYTIKKGRITGVSIILWHSTNTESSQWQEDTETGLPPCPFHPHVKYIHRKMNKITFPPHLGGPRIPSHPVRLRVVYKTALGLRKEFLHFLISLRSTLLSYETCTASESNSGRLTSEANKGRVMGFVSSLGSSSSQSRKTAQLPPHTSPQRGREGRDTVTPKPYLSPGGETATDF